MKKIYSIFALLFTWGTISAQHTAETAVAIPTDGGDIAVNYVEGETDYWYTYTATSLVNVAAKVCVSGYPYIQVFSDVASINSVKTGNLYCDPATYFGGGVNFQIENEDTYYIKLYTASEIESFSVDVEELTAGGASCDEPFVVTDGSHILPANVVGWDAATWISYTAPISGKLTFTAPDLTNASFITLYDDCNTQSSTYLTSDRNTASLMVGEGKTYLFKVQNMTPVALDLSCAAVEVGSSMDVAYEAQMGVNTCTPTRSGDYWYKIAPTESGYLEVNGCDFTDYFDGYASLCDYSGYPVASASTCEDGYGFSIRYKVYSGSAFYVKITTNLAKTAPFDFTIGMGEAQQGEDCSNPIPAQAGTNTYSSVGEVWYSYTPTKDGYLTVSNRGTVGFNGSLTLKADCNTWVASGNTLNEGGTELKYSVSAGNTYLISWNCYSAANFEFNITESDILPGDECSNPIEAVLGDNDLANLSTARDTYYSYTPSKDAWLTISICDEDWYGGSVLVTEGCGYMSLPSEMSSCESGSGAKYKVAAKAGVNYIIKVSNTVKYVQPLILTIGEVDFEEGESCGTAIELTNITDSIAVSEQRGSVWYKFTAPEDGFYTIASNKLPYTYGDGSSYIKTLAGDCDANPLSAPYDYEINTYSVKQYVTAESEVYINLYIAMQTADVNFAITYEEANEGDVCDKAIVVTDDFVCDSIPTERWYAYTPESSGSLTFSTAGSYESARMMLFEECGGYAIAYSMPTTNYDGTYISSSVEADKTYLLCIFSTYKDFTMDVTFESTTGIENVEVADAIAIAPNPNDGRFTLSLSAAYAAAPTEVSIITTQGKVVYKQTIDAGATKTAIDASHLTTGYYMLRVEGAAGSETCGFIVK